MMLPAVALLLVFCYYPMYGNIMAFQDFNPGLGFARSPLAGLKYFRTLFALPNIGQVFYNTVSIAVLKILFGTVASITTALMLNEVKSSIARRAVQTIIYMPYFMSWVILGTIFISMLDSDGIFNQMLRRLNLPPVFFLGDKAAFRTILVVSDVWKGVGFGTVVYLASITGIDPSLYEAAVVDGAGRWRQTAHVTLPGMMPIIVLLAMLNLGNLLNAGFDQIFVMYNNLVMDTADIIDTLVYRLGLQGAKFSLATAVGLFKSVIAVVLISLSYYIAYRYADYRVF
ncbi:MAG: sugar ABC transporter permease [Clostridiales bacterium]|nr:sugar ABC transporter permease [Clostridiales bacterium]